MPETTIENRVCNACGADVRPAALFCYSCGSSVAPQTVVALKDKENLSEAWFRESLAEEKNGGKPALIEQSVTEKIPDEPILQPIVQTETKLESAAAMRRQSKTIQTKRIEIVWEEHENAPNSWFILAAILLTVFAVGILFLAIYLK